MSEEKKKHRWPKYRNPADDDEEFDEYDDSRPAKLEKRRHRDPEKTDERWESERRSDPREGGRTPE